MSTNRNPLYSNTTGRTQLFSGEDTLAWNFTSATDNPMELSVGGVTFFIFERDGSFTLEKDVTWRSDSGGTVGDAYDLRPASVNIATTLTVGAISGAQPGALLTLNRLTIGHADVDKYIDAEQGLANTPALRYNAVNTRWEFSDNGIAYTAFSAGFGTTTWDALYAADKTLIIDAARLEFTQTSTTDVAFAFTRNLAAASTDAPIALVEQQNATDDQPALAVAQVATASALDIYEGTQAAGTIRYGFGALGKLTLTTNAALADSALHLIQNDTGQPFVTIEGTEGAGAGVSISTDSGATVDMVRVVVDGGAGATTRWLPAYDSTTIPGIPTWDSIYLSDKLLAINTTVLQFQQTSTSGRGFEVFRNLTAASTNNPIVVMEQQHASDDQPPLAIGQLAPTVDVLRLYNGSVASGTLSFQFSPRGRLNIVTHASLGSEAFRIEQLDNNVAFAEFKGTAAAGAGNNISTANGATGDMIRVTVDDGGGANTRWVPAYNSVTLPAAPTWDTIYAGDKTLDIDTTVLTFDQSSTTGFGFIVSRNLAAGSTDSPIMKVDQNSSADDQPALQVTGGIADIAGGVPVLEAVATSAGMVTAGRIMDGVRSTVVTHAADGVATFARAYRAVANTGAGGSAVTQGFAAAAGFDSGIYSESPLDILSTAGITANSATTALTVDQEGAGSILELLDTTVPRWVIAETGVIAHTPVAPTVSFSAHNIAVSSGGADGSSAVISALSLSTTGNVGDTNSLPIVGVSFDHTVGAGSEHSIAMLVTPGHASGLFIDSAPGANGSSILACNNGGAGLLLYLADGDIANLGGTTVNRLTIARDGETNLTIDDAVNGFAVSQTDTGGGTARILTLYDGDNAIDRVKVTQNGQVQIGADIAAPAMKLAQNNGTTAVILDCGEGTIASSTARFVVRKHGAVLCTPVSTTANLDVFDITAASGTLDAETLKGIRVGLTSHASDVNSALYYGIDLDMTDSGGVSVSMAIDGRGDWDTAFAFESDPAAAATSAVICNEATNASNLFYLGEGTVAASTKRFQVAVTGETSINASVAAPALDIKQLNTGGDILTLTDSVSAVIFRAGESGSIDIDSYDDTNGVRIGNSGTTTNLLELKDGTAAAGTQRLLVSDVGKVAITSDAALASEALEINQQDANEEFMYFNGTASDPAGGVTPADNITEVTGTGAVVGPAATGGAGETGWTFNGMIKIRVTAVGGGTVDVWIPNYSVALS